MPFISVIRVGIIVVRLARRKILSLMGTLHVALFSSSFTNFKSVGKLDRLIAVSCLVHHHHTFIYQTVGKTQHDIHSNKSYKR